VAARSRDDEALGSAKDAAVCCIQWWYAKQHELGIGLGWKEAMVKRYG